MSDNRCQGISVLMSEPFAVRTWSAFHIPFLRATFRVQQSGGQTMDTHYFVVSACPVPVYLACT
jgi:hypothetical protein